jgi:hypothetical protein
VNTGKKGTNQKSSTVNKNMFSHVDFISDSSFLMNSPSKLVEEF